MRLTADILQRAPCSLNTLHDRELNLRGFKIDTVENLGVLQDQCDLIDFSDNELTVLENFPRMLRLKGIYVCNNYLSRITRLGESLPNLETLMLMNNRINGLQEIDNLASFSKLELLSLLENPVVHLPNYRLYVIFRIPSLKCLDFQKVKRVEREEAIRFFNSPEGVSLLASVAAGDKSTRAVGSENRASHNTTSGAGGGVTPLTDEQKAEVRKAIESATTREQVDRIEKQLKTETFPFSTRPVDHV